MLIFISVSCTQKTSDPKPDNTVVITDDNPFDGENPTGCLAIDTDSDGIIDCKDDDMDNDGRLNEVDAFPKNPLEWIDTDGDGVGDNGDWSPTDPQESNDNDEDAVGDNADPDDDNDGVPDVFEVFYLRFDSNNWTDIDADSYGDQTDDEDKDNDGVPNIFDDLHWNKFGAFDIDGDYDPNNIDSDIDGDGFFNVSDSFPYDKLEWYDDDLDRIGNNIDPDDDGDGFPDSWEEFPRVKDEIFDTDGDGFSNVNDDFPFDPFEWLDSDGDGVGDNSDPFPNDSSESKDTDGDGIGNNTDEDIDNDGFLNCVPYNPEVTDTCNEDLFPLNKDEWKDNDLDGIGDNSDEDDDNDAIPDIFDTFPLNKLHFSDYDRDGIPDSTFPATAAQEAELPEGHVFFVWDADTDNDGVPNIFDDLPWDRFDYFDIDGDRIGNTLDLDDDGDGVADVTDLFPYDSTESVDFDQDGIGDNIDADDDGDGFPDLWDKLSFNTVGYSDLDGDGRPDQGNLDIDGDGVTNDQWECNRIQIDADTVYYDCGFKTYTLKEVDGFNNLIRENNIQHWCDYPKYQFRQIGFNKDLFVWNKDESLDRDYDCLGDNLIDEDNDNDGVPDVFDDFPNDDVTIKELTYFDTDGDGNANFTLKFNSLSSEWEFIVSDNDIDGDGTENFGYSCEPKADDNTVIQCFFLDLEEFRDPETNELINTAYYDAFPYNPNESRDEDKDGIGNNSDNDADNDGIENCIPIDVNSTDLCNQDELPLVGQFNSFISEEFDINPNNIIPYCADYGDCYYKNYDRDNDGLTDYEEYNLGTNPENPDTDGDTVPDLAERDDQTDPLDPSDWLDEDLDGTPNYFDKTPRGAFDENSFRQQISNSNSCRTKISEEICVDSQTNLCEWILTGETEVDPDTGETVNVGVCSAKEILITEDIEIGDCFNFTGDAKITSLFNNTITFTEEIAEAPRCSGNLTTAFNLDVNSNLYMKDIKFSTNTIDRLIYSEGKDIELENISAVLVGENDNNVIAVEHNRPSDGNLEIRKSSIRTITPSIPDDFSPIPPTIKATVSNLDLESNIIYCDILGNINEIYSFNCIDTESITSRFYKNNFYLKADNDNEEGDNLSYILSHNSLDSTVFEGDQYFFSSLLSLNLIGNGYILNNQNIFIAEGESTANEEDVDGEIINVPYGRYYLNNSSVETEFYTRYQSGEFFISNGENNLYCSKVPYDTNQPEFAVHPAYRASTPLDNKLNYSMAEFFNPDSQNLTPFGELNDELFRDYWKTLKVNGEDAYNYNLLAGSNDDGGYILLPPSDPQAVGIGRRFSVNANKTYEFSLRVEANNLDFRNIKMRVSIHNGLDNSLIKTYNIEFNPSLDFNKNINPETGFVTFLVPFTGENDISEYFQSPVSDIYIKIENSNIIETESVRVNSVKLLESIEYEFQYSGAKLPLCSLDN